MQEIYKDIIGYEGLYQISNFGNVKSFRAKNSTGKLRKLDKSKSGNLFYYRITLHKDNVSTKFLVHRLVAMHFLSTDEDYSKLQVNHIDNDGLNNHVSNLEWCTASENMAHSHKQLRQEHVKKAAAIGRAKNAKLKAHEKYEQYLNKDLNGRILLSFYSGGGKKIEYKGHFKCSLCSHEFQASLDATLRNQSRETPLYCRSCTKKQAKI